jgi:hypothetical protein
MNDQVLEERIFKVLTTTTMTQAPEYSTTTSTQEDGTVAIEMESTIKDVCMCDDMARVIAKSVAEAVVEFLQQSVVVQVPNAQAGAATLTGSLV